MTKTRQSIYKRHMQQRRHYLVRRLRDRFTIDPHNRTILLPSGNIEDIEPPDRYYVRQLLKAGFQSQLVLFP